MESLDSPVNTTIHIYSQDEDLDETSDSLKTTSLGDLYILGKLWIDILRTGLLGTKWRLPPLLPVVEAAAPPPPPQRPPKMKYKDLPLYASPHYEYKDYLEDQPRKLCPDYKRKLIHEKVLPYVKNCRKDITQNCSDFVAEVNTMKKTALCKARAKKNEFLCYMRSCENLRLRQGFVALGGLAGFILSRKFKGKTSPRIIYTAIGILAAGALCFPAETDENVRTVSLATGKFLILIYNKYCNRGFALREKVPCQRELPDPPPSRTANVCPQKKK